MPPRRELHIDRLGQRGEGVAAGDDGPVYVPYALAGETIVAEVEGERGKLLDIVVPSPDRIAAVCPYYGLCGGCAVQALAPAPYEAWKRGLLVEALRRAGIETAVDTLVDAHGRGRRRATFHARFDARGTVRVGFMQVHAHDLVALDACPILAPQLSGALDHLERDAGEETVPAFLNPGLATARAIAVARAVATALRTAGKPLDISVTASLTGLDVDVRGHGAVSTKESAALVRAADALDLARLSNHGERVVERRTPLLRMGLAEVAPPPGAFLQATAAGEAALAAKICASLAGARRIADLFAGLGTFALRLAEQAPVHAVDSDGPALAALLKAARSTPALKPVAIEGRDLFRRPLLPDELNRFDALVFDPPRAGAQAQSQALAASKVPLVVAVSCNVQTFARDAALLVAGGYTIDSITPVDQFRYSPHIETVGVLRRREKARRPRRLLG